MKHTVGQKLCRELSPFAVQEEDSDKTPNVWLEGDLQAVYDRLIYEGGRIQKVMQWRAEQGSQFGNMLKDIQTEYEESLRDLQYEYKMLMAQGYITFRNEHGTCVYSFTEKYFAEEEGQ